MGQSTSKQKTSKGSNSPSSAGPSAHFPTTSTPSPDEAAVAPSERSKRSRRSAIRRSIIGLVGKSKDSPGTTHSVTARSDAAPPSRKSWRRISRALSLGPTEDGRTALASVTPSKRKGKERAIDEVEGEDDEQPKQSTSSQRPESPAPTRRQSSASVLGNPLKTEDALPEPSTEHEDGSPPPPLELIDPPPTTTPALDHVDPPQDPTPPLHPPLDQPQPGPRHFPPPGTLVVVQGVVNTIDTGSTPNNNGNSNNSQTNNTAFPTTSSRPNSGLFSGSARSRPSTPTGEHSGSRNSRRLSSIIRRPAGMFNDSRRNTVVEGEGAADTSSPGRTIDSAIGTLADSPSDSTIPTTPSDSDPDSLPTQQRPLSPGSIDVLGTLLSVAAAATAASLFSPTSFAGRTEPPPESNIPRPTSPTPTAGLGVNGFGPLDALAELGFPMDRDQGLGAGVGNTPGTNGHNLSRERLRGAWDSLRERLGLRDGRNNPENIPEPFGDGRDVGRSGAGEAMITEMARALGTGLGLQEEGPGRPVDEPTVATPNVMAGAPSVPPPEGTFERFLYNLQADLRIVLSEDVTADQPGNVNGPAQPGDNEVSATPAEHPSDTDAPQVLISDHGDNQPLIDPSHPTEVTNSVETSDSTSPTILLPPTQSTPTTERRPAGGINLWRSYRFPPIIAPPRPSPPVPGADQTAVAPGSPLPTPPSILPSGSTHPGHPPRPDTPVPSSIIPSQPPPSAQTDVVVPVIIVGLQSVNVDSQRPEQPEEGEGLFARPDHRGDGVLPPEAWGHGEDGEQAMRGRPWHTRAADALRNLRPGRRNGPLTTNANDRAASRTFLIYVIGGYYPPSHHIVTGTDGMDSYDALWELAALIGQVKPPTATPEDIEKSGLQIIKSADIPHYAAEGGVASNCIDRCLICLDDYEPEEDLRVMSCKHFFHQNCVDKWLQVGRNNCPACRMKGVSTTADQDSNSIPVPPTIPTS